MIAKNPYLPPASQSTPSATRDNRPRYVVLLEWIVLVVLILGPSGSLAWRLIGPEPIATFLSISFALPFLGMGLLPFATLIFVFYIRPDLFRYYAVATGLCNLIFPNIIGVFVAPIWHSILFLAAAIALAVFSKGPPPQGEKFTWDRFKKELTIPFK
jgi:hypothetical protein